MDQVTDALKQTTLDPSIRRPPPPPSLANKRKPFALKLADINGAGDTVAAAGLGPGRPLGLDDPSESPAGRKTTSHNGVGTPFSNFRRIVYAYCLTISFI